MACLYCGKEIGPIRILRDKEFCSPKHRKEYKDRLQRVLVQVGEPETVPRDVAPFQDTLQPLAGRKQRSAAAFEFTTNLHRAQLPRTWSVAIPEIRGSDFADLKLSGCDLTSKAAASTPRVDALPYFGNTASAGLLNLPGPKLGTLLLRSSEGQLLSDPIALAFPVASPPSAQSQAVTPIARSRGVALPVFEVPGADCEELAPSETWMPAPVADPLTVVGEPAMKSPVPPAPPVHVPEGLPEAAIAAPDEFAVPPAVCETWMPGYAAEPAAREISPSIAAALPVLSALRLPVAFTANLAAPRPAPLVAYLAGPEPQAANPEAKLALPATAPLPAMPACPNLASLQISGPALTADNTGHLPVPASEPVEREVLPATACTPLACVVPALHIAPLQLDVVRDPLPAPAAHEPKIAARKSAPLFPVKSSPAPATPKIPKPAPLAPAAFSAPSLRFAALQMDAVRDPLPAPVAEEPKPEVRVAPPHAAGRKSAPFLPVASTPAPAKPKLPKPEPLAPVAMPAAAAKEQLPAEIPQPGLFAVDYHSPAGPMLPVSVLEWRRGDAGLHLPRFAVRPIFDRLEEPAAPKRESKKPAFAEIFTMPAAAAVTRRNATRHAFTAIAASVTVAMALWFGANAGKFGKELIRREADIASSSRMTSQPGGVGEIASAPSPARPAPDAFKHPVSWIRTEAAKRAAVQVADSFDSGMAAWGAKSKAMAAGWSHSADGYVRPGQLALFQPTLNFTDYRMEFFGQIENKSMSWVVRGKDTQNYYAMKFNVVEPGLRPVISMIHYPVVGGKQGHRVETPLSVMVHGDTPYHVAVEVKGSHYTASIEGQEVDSWSDDTLLAGGVGFFADAGSRARIYWTKVTKNDDWFGHLCNYIAGSTDAGDTAWLDRPALPAPTPESPAPAPATASLWPAELGESWSAKLQRGKGSVKGETEKWSS